LEVKQQNILEKQSLNLPAHTMSYSRFKKSKLDNDYNNAENDPCLRNLEIKESER
jgi:hypothetical protein